jgi:Domain of unknown function (DUF4331)
MPNHFSADNLKFPGDDRRLDLTDVFLFTSADDPGRTVLIIDSNPTSAPPPIPAPVTGPEFYPDAVYRINIDNDGDNHADVAFTFVFSAYQDGVQTGTAWYATGSQARQPDPAGEVLARAIPVSFDGTAQPVQVRGIRLFTGLRSDPFFADVEGALHGFSWTGHDDFAGNNVDSIVLEVPHDMLGAGVIGVWASISRYQDGIERALAVAGAVGAGRFGLSGPRKAVARCRDRGEVSRPGRGAGVVRVCASGRDLTLARHGRGA